MGLAVVASHLPRRFACQLSVARHNGKRGVVAGYQVTEAGSLCELGVVEVCEFVILCVIADLKKKYYILI